MSILRYLNELEKMGQIDPSKLAQTDDGIPIRNLPDDAPLREEDMEEIHTIGLAHVRTFLTNNEEDMKEYQKVLNKILCNQSARIVPDKEEFLSDQKCWQILVRWADLTGIASGRLMNRLYGSDDVRVPNVMAEEVFNPGGYDPGGRLE